jgi:hypothetical protein
MIEMEGNDGFEAFKVPPLNVEGYLVWASNTQGLGYFQSTASITNHIIPPILVNYSMPACDNRTFNGVEVWG